MKACLLALLFVLLLSVPVSMAQREDLTKQYVSQYLPIAFDMPADWKVIREERDAESWAIGFISYADFVFDDSDNFSPAQLQEGEVLAVAILTTLDQIEIETASFDDSAVTILKKGMEQDQVSLLRDVEPMAIRGYEAAQVTASHEDSGKMLYGWIALAKIDIQNLDFPPYIEDNADDDWIVVLGIEGNDQVSVEANSSILLAMVESVRYVPILGGTLHSTVMSNQEIADALQSYLSAGWKNSGIYFCPKDPEHPFVEMPNGYQLTEISCTQDDFSASCRLSYGVENQKSNTIVNFMLKGSDWCISDQITPNG